MTKRHREMMQDSQGYCSCKWSRVARVKLAASLKFCGLSNNNSKKVTIESSVSSQLYIPCSRLCIAISGIYL